jgi:polyferredoxin
MICLQNELKEHIKNMKTIIYKYLVYVIYFLGIGMTSSGIVLMPFNTVRYSIILIIGLGLFLAGSIFNEIVINNHKMTAAESVKLISLSLTLALGIGMISGGISHFKESPVYVAYLIPMGIIISFISFIMKNNLKLTKKEKYMVYIGVVVIALILLIILFLAASSYSMDMNPGGDIFKMEH